MKVIFDNAILCNVVPFDFEGKEYWKLHVYSGSGLYKLSIKPERLTEARSLVGKRVSLFSDLREFTNASGKTVIKYYLSDDSPINVIE